MRSLIVSAFTTGAFACAVDGRELEPSAWKGAAAGGHHREGEPRVFRFAR